MTTPSTPRRLPPAPPSTPTSKATLPSVRLSLCVPPSTPSKSTSSPSPNTSTPHSSACLHQGFLAKRSHGHFWQKKDWTLPWVVIDRTSRTLRLYTDSEVLRHPELKAKRVYGLQGLDVMVKENENRKEEAFGGKAKWSFDLILKEAGKKMELGCDSREERQKWIDAFDQCRQEEADKENRKGGGKQPVQKAMTSKSSAPTPQHCLALVAVPPVTSSTS